LDLAEFFLRRKFSPIKRDYIPSRQIPKTIHFAWFGGGRIPEHRQKNIDTWRRLLPDYEIVRWDENNFPIESYPYAVDAYNKGIYAFVSDVARLHAVYKYGGLYMDTNNEVIRPDAFDDLLSLDCFASYEAPCQISISTFGAKPNHPYIGTLLDFYKFIRLRSAYRLTANVRFISKLTRIIYGSRLNGKRLTLSDGTVILPRDLFVPQTITENTRVIHHYRGSWK
jgi:mannosyltransferase OCH1-like enzyme